MSDDDVTCGAPTRREYTKYGGAVATDGLLAECSDDGEFAPRQFPDVPTDEQSFDRQRTTDIIEGAFSP